MIATAHPTSSTSPKPSSSAPRRGLLLALGIALLVGFVAGAGWARAATPPSGLAVNPASPEPVFAAKLPPIRRELPREYREWLPKPITFDHMYRQSGPVRFR